MNIFRFSENIQEGWATLIWGVLLVVSLLCIFYGIRWVKGKKKGEQGDKLKKALGKSRQAIWQNIKRPISQKMDKQTLEKLEELLHASDMGPAIAEEILSILKKQRPEDPHRFLFDLLKEKMEPVFKNGNNALFRFDPKDHILQTIMVVGVNGAGKTTSIGKLAAYLQRQGARVVIGAGDTFRAAAVEQLKKWCDRACVPMVKADKETTPPSAVGFSALAQARQTKADYCILDTAGRLHTNENLMKELEKVKRVLKKQDPAAPQHILLVVDAISGQNTLRQAKQFHQVLGLTGIIFTKCDSSAKAGSAIPIVQSLKVPISYIGVGEGIDDLVVFNLDKYLEALIGG